jgi:hypothetical protein
VNPAIVPDELYFRTNTAELVVTGNVYPEGTSELFRAKLFIVTVPVELYAPVTDMFPDVSVVILYPPSLPKPLSLVNPVRVPAELYFRMNTSLKLSLKPPLAGNVYPELTSELFRAKLFIGTVPVERYDPVTYMFPDVSAVILLPASLPKPLSAVNPVRVPSELYFRMNMSVKTLAGNVYPELTSELFRAKLFIGTVPVELYAPVTYMFPDVSAVIL